jgi:Zn-dependent M32 family carboxypeptidase
MSKPILYLSFDVETDGPSPLINNLLSIGIVGLEEDSMDIVFEFESNIKPLPTHIPDSQCMETFWLKPEQKTSYEYLQINPQDYIKVFEDLSQRLQILSNKYKLIWVAQPACFDWMFFKSYYEMAKTQSPNKELFYEIGYQCKCVSTLFDLYKKSNNLSSKQATKLFNELGEFNPELNHQSLSDAKVQGKFFVKLIKKMI